MELLDTTSWRDSNTLCRTCLQVLSNDALDTSKHDIFLTPEVVKKLVLCTSLTVEPQDGYPKHLCDSCYAKVNQFHQFQAMCVESAQRFRESMQLQTERCSDSCDSNNPGFDDEKPVFDLDAQAKVEITIGEADVLCPSEDPEKLEMDVLFKEGTSLDYTTEDVEITQNRRRRGRPTKTKTLKTTKMKQEPAIEVLPQKRKRRCLLNSNEDAKAASIGAESNGDWNKDCISGDCNALEAQHEKTNIKMKNKNKRKCRQRRNSSNSGVHPDISNNNKDPTRSSVFQCDRCPTRFFAEHRLTAHKRSHDGLSPYPCPRDECDRAFNRWHCLSEHLKQHEGTNRWFACTEPDCDKVYKHKPTLAMHLRKFHKRGPELKSHICEICGKVFKASAILNDHRYTHKAKSELPYACEQAPDCLRRFSNKEKLKVHMLRHAGIKNFVCPYCGMRKTTRNELKIHINYHTLERTWPCRYCAHVCNSAGNLKMHVRTVHERAKDYACRYCERTFAKPDTRKYHEMTHTGEKPNECGECGKRFTQPAALRTHRKIHQRLQAAVTTSTASGGDSSCANVATVAVIAPPVISCEPPPQQILQQREADVESNLQHLLQATSSI